MGGRASPREGFVIASDEGKDQMMGAAAGGSKGTCPVVYVEPRGADDCKVLAWGRADERAEHEPDRLPDAAGEVGGAALKTPPLPVPEGVAEPGQDAP